MWRLFIDTKTLFRFINPGDGRFQATSQLLFRCWPSVKRISIALKRGNLSPDYASGIVRGIIII